MRKLLSLLVVTSFIPLACSSLPPQSARTNPIYYPQEIRPPLIFESVPAVQPASATPATSVAERYYPVEVWWNQNFWSGTQEDWWMLPLTKPDPGHAVFRNADGCYYRLEPVNVHRLRPGMGDAPSMRLVTEFYRQKVLLYVEDHAKSRVVLTGRTQTYGPNKAGFMVILKNGKFIRNVFRSDYSVSLNAVAGVISVCPAGDPASDRLRDLTAIQIADSLTFVRQ